jgi:hypothetical protein
MFFSGATCAPTHVLSLPQEDTIGLTGLPSPSWPSDHLSLRVHFTIASPGLLQNPLSFESENFDGESSGKATLRRSGISNTELLDEPEGREKKGALAMCCGCSKR